MTATAATSSGRADTALIFGAAALLFAASATGFGAHVTDLSALRMLQGDIPYRDFWTMYAPGSFTVLAAVFAVFGQQLIVSNVLGILTSAAAVAAYYHLARRSGGRQLGLVVSVLMAVSFFGVGYYQGFTSYPPALLLILLAVSAAAARCQQPGSRWAIVPGLLIGAAVLFKHDIAGYAALAVGAGIVVARLRAGLRQVLVPLAAFAGAAAVLPAAAIAVLVWLGAAQDAWNDLVRFPLTDFPLVRPESIPILPRFHGSRSDMAAGLVRWGICNFPLIGLGAGWYGLWRGRARLDATSVFIAVTASCALGLHYSAAQVQLNTHAISLTVWGALVAGAGLQYGTVSAGRLWKPAGVVAVALWGAVFLARPAYRALTTPAEPTEWLGLPRLSGIRVPAERAGWMRGLATAISHAETPDAPLLFVGNRNDLNLFAASTPFWLTPRRSATRHHELHPGITDTEAVQRQMLSDVLSGPYPVVVREHRFTSQVVDQIKARMMAQGVRVGSTLMDEWIAQHYESQGRFGPYELMARKDAEREIGDRD